MDQYAVDPRDGIAADRDECRALATAKAASGTGRQFACRFGIRDGSQSRDGRSGSDAGPGPAQRAAGLERTSQRGHRNERGIVRAPFRRAGVEREDSAEAATIDECGGEACEVRIFADEGIAVRMPGIIAAPECRELFRVR